MVVEQSEASRPRRSHRHRRGAIIIVILILILVGAGLLYSQRHLLIGSHLVGGNAGLTHLHLPPGFQADGFSTGLSSPRFMTFGPDGTLFVAERGTGSISAFPRSQKGGARKIVVVSGLDDPTSLDFYQGAFYVGEATRISRFTLGPDLRVIARQIVIPNLPSGGQHSTRTVLVGPDGNLYVSIGSSCNVCIESDPRRAAIWMYRLDGSGGRLYARGLRNAVGLAINPWNKQVWVTNNGRDALGDPLSMAFQILLAGNVLLYSFTVFGDEMAILLIKRRGSVVLSNGRRQSTGRGGNCKLLS